MSVEATVESQTKPKVKKVKKQVTVETSEPVSVPEPVSTPEPVSVSEPVSELVTQSTKPVEEESSIELLFNKLITQFQDIQNVMKTLHSNIKVLQKEVSKERKETKKIVDKKSKKKSGNKKAPSGFAKPSAVSADLAEFLGLAADAQIARTDVTKKVIEYVKEHNLQNPASKMEILPDEKLKKLLGPAEGDIIKFFNIQTYLKKHFLPAVVV
jgi:chromatin remodeling complex protein RSC6